MNFSASLNAFRLLWRPSICLPHCTVADFNDIPIPLDKAFSTRGERAGVDIRAVVLDKDSCFAKAEENEVFDKYKDHFRRLRAAYPGSRLLIVSNSSGSSSDPTGAGAEVLERTTGVDVLRHETKKPGCGTEVMEYFYSKPDSGVTSPKQVAVVGDRLLTDVMMASLMGSWGLWIRDGLIKDNRLFPRSERILATYLFRRGLYAPLPH